MEEFNHGNIKWDRSRRPNVCVPGTGYFLNSTCIRINQSSEAIAIVLSPQKEFVDNVVIQEPLGSGNHNQLHFNINIKSDKKVKQCRRAFRKGTCIRKLGKEIRKSLVHIDWKNKMKNKTATECWHILRSELDSPIDRYVPMKKLGKRSKKKRLSKEAFRKIVCFAALSPL